MIKVKNYVIKMRAYPSDEQKEQIDKQGTQRLKDRVNEYGFDK